MFQRRYKTGIYWIGDSTEYYRNIGNNIGQGHCCRRSNSHSQVYIVGFELLGNGRSGTHFTVGVLIVKDNVGIGFSDNFHNSGFQSVEGGMGNNFGNPYGKGFIFGTAPGKDRECHKSQ